MRKRHETIGIKQVIRFEWMQKTTNLLLAGLDTKSIRKELHEYLENKKGNGSDGERSNQTRTFVVDNLINIWAPTNPELIPFRDASLAFLHEHPSMSLAIHWGIISAAYPFWFNVARQTGRLLALQSQVTRTQIINRLKEHYGDRQTVSRYAQYVIRSFVAWGVLKDANAKGCYEKATPLDIADTSLAILMFESTLLATSEAKGVLSLIRNNPAFFPFQLPVVTRDHILRHSDRIEVTRSGLDDELLNLSRVSQRRLK